MKRPSLRGIVALSGICAIAASLFISHLFAQTYGSGTYSGSGSSGSSSSSGYTSYIQSGPAANMQMSGYLNFQLPLARAGHAFSLKYRNNGGTFLTGSANVVGIATGPGASGAATPLYLAVAAPLPNYPNLPAEWYLLDTTNVPQEARHQTLGLVNAQWHSTGVSDTYFAIPSARLGHALIVGSTAAGWIQLNQGQVLGAYVINGSTVTYQPGTWLEAWGPASAPFYVADLTSGQKYTDQNATEALVAERWVQDSSIYPVKDVTFFLDAAELPWRYTLHWKPTTATLEVLQPLVPAKVMAQISNQVLANGSTATIPANSATVHGTVASGSEFWLTRDFDGASTPRVTMTAALYNLATPKVWSWISAAGTSPVVPPVSTAGWETVYFGVNSNYGATAFELNTPTFKIPAETVETNLRIQDYAGGVPHDFVYHLLKGMVPHEYNLPNDKKFWLKASIVSYGMGEQWLYGGWSWVGGQPGVLPPSSPGVFNFSLQMQGARGEHRFSLTPPDQSAGGLLGGGFTGTKTLLDPWHPEAPTWTTPASTRTSSLFYSGPAGPTDGWLLRDEDSGDTHLLYPQALTNFTVDLTGWLLPPVPMNLQVSASRFGHLLYLRQKDSLSSSFMVDPYAMQGSFAQYGEQTYYTPYYYFEAVASRRADQWVDYWVHDDTTGEDSPANQPMLINWISTPTPSAPTIAEHGDTLEARWPLGIASSLGAYRLERKAAADTEWLVVAEIPADTADAEHWVTQLDQPTDPSLSFQYRLAYLFGGQISAYSPVTPFQWQDSDGDGLPDSWETAWGMKPNLADPPFAWLVGAGLSARQLFAQGARRVDYPATALQWDAKKRLHAYHYLAAGGGNGIVWQDWEGDAVYSANVIVEQEESEGVWVAIAASAVVSDGSVEWNQSFSASDNFRLTGEVTSCETLEKVRMMARNTEIDRDHPGLYDSYSNRYYLRHDWGEPGHHIGWEELDLVGGNYRSSQTDWSWNGSKTTTLNSSFSLVEPGIVSETSTVSGTPAGDDDGTVVGTYQILLKHWVNPVDGLDEENSEPTAETYTPAGKVIPFGMGISPLSAVSFSNEYSVSDFFRDTLSMIKPMLLKSDGRRQSHLGDQIPQQAGAWTLRKYAELPYCDLSPDDPQSNFFSASGLSEMARRDVSSHRIHLKKSEYWIECNDCEPGKTVTAIEIETLNGPPEVKTVQRIVSFTAGTQPGKATQSEIFQSQYPGSNGNKVLSPLPVDLAVDADRDGTIASGESASQAKPFRFWINNDDDPNTLGDDVEAAMKVDERTMEAGIITPAGFEDWKAAPALGHIEGVRDLEDFTRLHMTLPSDIVQKAKAGEVQVGFKWTNGSGPRIRVYKAQGDEGDEKFLFYKYEANLQVDSDHQSALADVKGSQTAFLPSSYWQGIAAGTSKLNFIFEGCEKGAAKLTTVIKFGSSAEAEGAGVWIKLMDVQEMFERGKVAAPMSEPDNVPDPWVTTEPLTFQSTPDLNGNAFQPDPDETKQYIIHVHGWRMSYNEAQTWANTSFKRLWHLGYKGRYAFFSWPTYSAATSYFDGYLTYNKSEYRAWLSGAALKSYVASLPSGYTKNIMAHSMGNVVVGSAFRQGMGGLSNYALFNAAMAAQAYDPSRVDFASRQTPDTDSDPTVQTRFGLSSKFSGITARVTNFYLEDDFATKIWSANHYINKPQGLLAPLDRAYGYSNSGWTVGGSLHKLVQLDPIVLAVPLRGVTMTEEAMAYVSQTRSLPAGRTPTNLGFTGGWQIDMDRFVFENNYRSLFGSEHSAEWIWSLQRTFGVWRALLYSFDINPNPVP